MIFNCVAFFWRTPIKWNAMVYYAIGLQQKMSRLINVLAQQVDSNTVTPYLYNDYCFNDRLLKMKTKTDC